LLHLHIGSHKTGTSSIQATFFGSRERLRDLGIDYFGFSANHSQPMLWRFGTQRFTHPVTVGARMSREDVLRTADAVDRELRDFLRNPPFPTKVISGEEISTLGESDVAQIKAFLANFSERVHVIIYVRNYYDYMNSEIQELVKWGWTLPDLKAAIARGQVVQPNYKGRIQKFITHFGRENVTVRIFHRDRLKQGDLFTDFCDAIGAPAARDVLSIKTTNKSLSASSVRLLSLYNEAFPARVEGTLNPARTEKMKNCLSEIEGPKYELHDPDLLRAYRESIQADADYMRDLVGVEVDEVLLVRGPNKTAAPSELDEARADQVNALSILGQTLLDLEDQRAALSLLTKLIATKTRGPADGAVADTALKKLRSDALCRQIARALIGLGRTRIAHWAAQRALEIDASDAENIRLHEQTSQLVTAQISPGEAALPGQQVDIPRSGG
jgi:hypothetical protein